MPTFEILQLDYTTCILTVDFVLVSVIGLHSSSQKEL